MHSRKTEAFLCKHLYYYYYYYYKVKWQEIEISYIICYQHFAPIYEVSSKYCDDKVFFCKVNTKFIFSCCHSYRFSLFLIFAIHVCLNTPNAPNVATARCAL